MRMVTIHGSKQLTGAEAKAVVIDASRAFRLRQETQVVALSRRPQSGEGASIRFAMRSVEQRIVKGLWVLELALPSDGPKAANRNGIDYMNDGSDVDARYTDAAGGKWEPPLPRPAVPSSREIDAAKEAKGWIEWLDEDQARLLTVAAMTKRGDRNQRVKWTRVVSRLRHLEGMPLRTLQDRYDRALRRIVAELTIIHAAK